MKRVLAVLGIIVLLAVAAMPMIFAFDTGENSGGRFRAALGAAILIPVMIYIFYMVYRMLKKEKKQPTFKIKNVVFDLGRVLVNFDWETYLDSFGFPQEEREVLANAIFRSEIWNERDRGALPPEAYIDQMVRSAPDNEEDIRRVMATIEKVIQPLDYADTWVAFLKNQGYRVYILSNYSQDTLDATRHLMPFLNTVDGAVFSCEEKLIKPEKEIYKVLLSRYALRPEETVFLDDREDNCEAARACGITAIHFRSFSQAAGELHQLLGIRLEGSGLNDQTKAQSVNR